MILDKTLTVLMSERGSRGYWLIIMADIWGKRKEELDTRAINC